MTDTITVYKVYDDEWEDIQGPEDLKEFTLMQMVEKVNTSDHEEIEDDIKCYIDENMQEDTRKLMLLCENGTLTTSDYTIPQAIELLKLRFFDVDTLYLH